MADCNRICAKRDLFQADQAAADRAMIVQREFMHVAQHEELQPPAPPKVRILVQTSRAESNHLFLPAVARAMPKPGSARRVVATTRSSRVAVATLINFNSPFWA